MAKVLTELPKRHGGGGRKESYPYDEWLDGQIWQLEEGTDYKSKTASMLTNIRQAADKRNLKVRTRLLDDGKTLVVQSYKPEPEEAPEAPAPAPAKRNGRK
jgi:hypothetical protein